MSKAVIRKMHESDLNIVSELAMLANPHATKEEYSRLVLNELKKNLDLSFITVESGKVVGYVLADTQNNDKAVLEDIAVAREYQGRSTGKRLLDTELMALEHKGVKTVVAEVHYKCASAIPFYYGHGFRITGFEQDYFGVGHDAIILKMLLHRS